MGYDTNYFVVLSDIPSDSVDEIEERLGAMVDDFWHAGKNSIEAQYYGNWWEWDKDLLKLSSDFPEVFIVVDGDGEDSDDFWKAYIKDGAIQIAPGRITYDEYDPAKMQERIPPSLPKVKAEVEDLL